MRCDCGQAFTRRTDLRSHVELVHAGDKCNSTSVCANVSAEALEGQGQSGESASSFGPPAMLGSQELLRCNGYPPCSKIFQNEEKFERHIRYIFARSSKVRVILTVHRTHKGWAARRSKQGGLLAKVKRTTNIAAASTSGTNSNITATRLSVDRLSSLPSQGRGQEVITVESMVGVELTATSLQVPGAFINVVSREHEGEAASAAAANTPTADASGDDTRQESTVSALTRRADMWSNHPGMGFLPKILQQLQQSVVNELEDAAVQALPDPRLIFRHMQTVTKTTAKVIAKVLSPYRYASFVEYQATCLEDVTGLSTVVFGDTRDEEIRKVAYGIQSQKKMNTETVLRAYTAAAVTQWVLRVDFRDGYRARGTVCNGPDIRRQSMEDFVKRGW
jgi:hypothetical protein